MSSVSGMHCVVVLGSDRRAGEREQSGQEDSRYAKLQLCGHFLGSHRKSFGLDSALNSESTVVHDIGDGGAISDINVLKMAEARG